MNAPRSGWARCTVADLIEIKYGKALPEKVRVAGDVHVYGSNGQVGMHTEALTNGATIIIGRKGSIGEIHRSDAACFPIDTAYYVDEFGELTPRFLELLLKFLNLPERNRASAIPGLNRDEVYSLSVDLPPLSEHNRITTSHDELTAHSARAREELQRVSQLIDRYRRSVLTAAFRGHLTNDWRRARLDAPSATEYVAQREKLALDVAEEPGRGRDERSAQAKPDDDLRRDLEKRSGDTPLPPTWCWVGLGQVFGIYVGATPSRRVPEYWNGDIPWVSSGEVAFCRIADTHEKITEEGLGNASTRMHPKGTVLLGMIGEGKTRGQAAILDIEACNNQNCAAIRVSEAGYPPEYIYWYLYLAYEATRTAGAGNNQPALNKDRVQRLPIPLAPAKEAVAVVEIIQTAFDWLDTVTSECARVDDLLPKLDQAVLAKAFRGALVPQDLADEPASKLLERICEARTSSSARGSRRKAS